MLIKILYISKNTTLRCYTKLDFNVTYRFGHNSGISLPFLFKVGSKCPYLKGVLRRQPVCRFGSNRFYHLKSTQPQPVVRSSPVFGLFAVAWTGPANTNEEEQVRSEKTLLAPRPLSLEILLAPRPLSLALRNHH